MSVMRKKIAEHMVAQPADVGARLLGLRGQLQPGRRDPQGAHAPTTRQRGVKLTFTSFIAKVAIDCLRRHKVINASIDGDNVVYKREINLGVAVALENGSDRAGRQARRRAQHPRAVARDRRRRRSRPRQEAQPDEVHGGTFTITNPGNFGAQFGLPIINQPQVAILGVGTIEKRPVVIDDMIGIRLMGYLTLGYDHRLVDGAVADQFMADVKKGIETFDPFSRCERHVNR